MLSCYQELWFPFRCQLYGLYERKKLPFTTLSLIDENIYIMLSIGSSETADSSSLYSLGIFMFRDLTALLKMSPRILATSKSSWTISYPSISVISVLTAPLSVKKGFAVFQNVLLSLRSTSYVPFCRDYCKNSFVFYRPRDFLLIYF